MAYAPAVARPGKPSISDAEAARVVVLMRGLLPEYGTKTGLGDALGISQSAVTQILAGKIKAGDRTARRAAKLAGYGPDAWRDPEDAAAVFERIVADPGQPLRAAAPHSPLPPGRGQASGLDKVSQHGATGVVGDKVRRPRKLADKR